MMRRKKSEQEHEQQMREACRPDDRTLRVLARLEAARYRYDRSVQKLENLASTIAPDSGQRDR